MKCPPELAQAFVGALSDTAVSLHAYRQIEDGRAFERAYPMSGPTARRGPARLDEPLLSLAQRAIRTRRKAVVDVANGWDPSAPSRRFRVCVVAIDSDTVALLAEDLSEVDVARRSAAAAHAELRRFLYIVSHDLNAPFRTIRNFSSLLATHCATWLDDRSERYVTHLVAAADQGSRILADLLVLSRIETSNRPHQDVELHVIVDAARAELREHFDAIGAQVHVGSLAGITVRGDPEQLRQALVHVLENCLTYRRSDVRLDVRVNARTAKRGRVEVDVRDNGRGIALKHVENVFEPFFRAGVAADSSARGMGLAIVRRVASRHGGTASLTSSPGAGTAVRLDLPGTQTCA